MAKYNKIHQELDQYINDHYFINVLLFKQDTSTIELINYGKK